MTARAASEAPNRLRTLTMRVTTGYGSHYVHLAYDDAGRVHEVSISSTGKFSDTAIAAMLNALAAAVTEALTKVGGAT